MGLILVLHPHRPLVHRRKSSATCSPWRVAATRGWCARRRAAAAAVSEGRGTGCCWRASPQRPRSAAAIRGARRSRLASSSSSGGGAWPSLPTARARTTTSARYAAGGRSARARGRRAATRRASPRGASTTRSASRPGRAPPRTLTKTRYSDWCAMRAQGVCGGCMGRLVGCAWQAGWPRRGYRTILIGNTYYGHARQVLLVEASDEASWSGWAAVALWAYESCRAFLRWEHGTNPNLTSSAPIMSTPALTTTHTESAWCRTARARRTA